MLKVQKIEKFYQKIAFFGILPPDFYNKIPPVENFLTFIAWNVQNQQNINTLHNFQCLYVLKFQKNGKLYQKMPFLGNLPPVFSCKLPPDWKYQKNFPGNVNSTCTY